MDLYLLRHGQTVAQSTAAVGRIYGQSTITNGINEKTLTFDGKAEVGRVGEALRILNIKLDAIITSPLNSSYQTAEIINSILFGSSNARKSRISQQHNKFQVWNDLAPEGDTANVFKNLSKFKYDSKILVVGHEPFLSRMIVEILNSAAFDAAGTTGGGNSFSSSSYMKNVDRCIVLKKAGLAKLRVYSKSQKFTGELRWLLTPMLLRKLSLAKKKSKIKSQRKLNMATEAVSPSRR